METAAVREFKEETGFNSIIAKLIDVSELIEPEKPWHSITITYSGKIIGGEMKIEEHSKYGRKESKWFSREILSSAVYRPTKAVNKAVGFSN